MLFVTYNILGFFNYKLDYAWVSQIDEVCKLTLIDIHINYI